MPFVSFPVPIVEDLETFGPPPPPPSLVLNWAQVNERNTGSGFGGSDYDKTLRNKGKKEAQKREQGTWAEWQQQLEIFLKEHEKEDIATEKHPVMDVLKKVLRCQAPNWWWKQPQRKTYILALRVSICLVEFHPKTWGTLNDVESAFAALDELARACKLLVGSSKSPKKTLDLLSEQLEKATKRRTSTNDKDLFLPECVLELRDAISNLIVAGDCFGVMSPEEHYRQKMRPLAFDLVSAPLDSPKHYYGKERRSSTSRLNRHTPETNPKQQTKNNSKSNRATTALWKELSAYPTGLPIEYGSSVFVRAHEANLDKLRVLIIGPEDTPYANGCFFFDVSIGDDYPHRPPKVQFLTTTMCAQGPKPHSNAPVRFNPNLYANGKVCLSLLGTWSGPGWISKESTLLQVLVSLQSLVLGSPAPYFNEPGYQHSEGTKYGDAQSKQYNQDIRRKTLRVAMLPFLYNLQRLQAKGCKKRKQASACASKLPPSMHNGKKEYFPEFRKVLQQHFLLKNESIRKQLRLWRKEDASLGELSSEFWEVHVQIMETKKQQRKICKATVVVVENDELVTSLLNDQNPVTNAMAIDNSGVIELLDDDDDENDRKPAANNEKIVDLT